MVVVTPRNIGQRDQQDMPESVVDFGRDHPELKDISIGRYMNLSLLGKPPEYLDLALTSLDFSRVILPRKRNQSGLRGLGD